MTENTAMTITGTDDTPDYYRNNSTYLGDGVYVCPHKYDPSIMVLFTSDGVRMLNTIYLEPEVTENLVRFTHNRKG